jgi:hypothetical protein
MWAAADSSPSRVDFSQLYRPSQSTAGKWPQMDQGTLSGTSLRITAITRSNLSDSIIIRVNLSERNYKTASPGDLR